MAEGLLSIGFIGFAVLLIAFFLALAAIFFDKMTDAMELLVLRIMFAGIALVLGPVLFAALWIALDVWFVGL